MHRNSEAQAELKELKSFIENTFKDDYNNIEDNLKDNIVSHERNTS